MFRTHTHTHKVFVFVIVRNSEEEMEEKQWTQYCYYVDIQGQTQARVTMCHTGSSMEMK